jgi:succinyl-diaminopimelate desuccinylase
MKTFNFKKTSKIYYHDALNALIELIKIPSVYDEPSSTSKMPYGKNVNDALQWIQRFGEIHGFDSKIIDGRCVEMTIGSGKKLISIFAHTDVVPVTGKWDSDPFIPLIKGNLLYGRGSTDDKGPLIAAFYGAKMLYDNHLVNDYRIRIVIGGDEERGSSCLEHYFSQKDVEIPTYGFTPDANFPVVYGEKGISNFESSFVVSLPNVISISGGIVPNSVIDSTIIVLKERDDGFVQYLRKNAIEFDGVENKITILGKSAHGSTPELGKNAGIIALKSLAEYYDNKVLISLVSKISDYTGKAFDCFYKTDNLGETTFNIGILNYKDNKLIYLTNFRYPENVDVNQVLEEYDNNLNTLTRLISTQGYLLFDKSSFLVKSLMKAYSLETNDYKSLPLFLGGGTYAKDAKNTVAFGPERLGENCHIHEANECIYLDSFYQCISIYAHAIYLLGTSKDENKI